MIDSKHLKNNIPSSKLLELPQEFGWGLSDDITTPTIGLTEVDRFTNKFKCSDVRISLSTGDTSNIIYVDIHKNDVSIFDTQVSIDISGSTSVSATTPFIFSLSANTVTFIDDEEVKFYVSGATDCTGLKVKLIGDRIINYDEATTAFISVVTGLTQSQETAINDLVVGLKNNGTWDKHSAIYPMIGGTAYNHKWNLKDPRDLDAAHRITWGGSVTHDLSGITGNGTDAYGNMHFNKNDFWSSTNVGYSIYSRSDTRDIGTEFGVRPNISGAGHLKIHLRYTIGFDNTISDMFGDTEGTGRFLVNPSIPSAGLFSVNQLGGTSHNVYKNTDSAVTNTGDYTANFASVPAIDIYILAHNRETVGATEFTSRNLSFFSAGDALTATEITNDYTVIQAYQTALGRQV